MSRKLDFLKRSESPASNTHKSHTDLRSLFYSPTHHKVCNGKDTLEANQISTLKKCRSGSIEMIKQRQQQQQSQQQMAEEVGCREIQSAQSTPTHQSVARPQKALKNFFHRIGSTGMLNHRSHNLLKASEAAQMATPTAQTLYRSSSTSQLSSCSYIKCDDPSDGLSLHGHQQQLHLQHQQQQHQKQQQQQQHHHLQRMCSLKSSSCDDIVKVSNYLTASSSSASAGGKEVGSPPNDNTGNGAGQQDASRRAAFPYAFLRSRLSVLPEENGGSVLHKQHLHQQQQQQHPKHLETVAHTQSPLLHRRSPEELQLANVSRNDSISSKDWEPLYQRLSSCLSSNESGYDSDGGGGGAGMARLCNNLSISGGDTESIASGILKRNSLISLSSSEGVSMAMGTAPTAPRGLTDSLHQNVCSASPASRGGYNYDYETETIRRRFRHLILERKCQEDYIGLVLSPKMVLINNNEQQYRYLIVELEPFGMAQK